MRPFVSNLLGTHSKACSCRNKRRHSRASAERDVRTLVSHGAHDYKLRWSTAFVPSTRLFLFSRNSSARLSRFVRFKLASIWQKLGATDP